jgi:hypothetical protein
MMTPQRFRALAASYGADLQRWPEAERDAARALVHVSPAARSMLATAQRLDAAIAAASSQEHAATLQSGEEDAALARLRSGVASGIAASARPRQQGARHGWTLGVLQPSDRFSPAGVGAVVVSGAIAIMAGLLIGTLYTWQPSPDGLLATLQPAPFHLLEDSAPR